jgi:hypothetical protein
VGCVERLAVLRNAETVSKGNEHERHHCMHAACCMLHGYGRRQTAGLIRHRLPPTRASSTYIGPVRCVYFRHCRAQHPAWRCCQGRCQGRCQGTASLYHGLWARPLAASSYDDSLGEREIFRLDSVQRDRRRRRRWLDDVSSPRPVRPLIPLALSGGIKQERLHPTRYHPSPVLAIEHSPLGSRWRHVANVIGNKAEMNCQLCYSQPPVCNDCRNPLYTTVDLSTTHPR